MDKTRTIGHKFLVNRRTFCVLQNYAKAQSNPLILSKVIVVTDDDDRHRRKNHLFSLRGSQNVEIL